MPLESIPLWGQLGIAGVPLLLIVWVIYAILKGDLVTRKHVEQVQAMADTYLKAFQVAQETTEKQAALLKSLTATSETMAHLIEALPTSEDVGKK